MMKRNLLLVMLLVWSGGAFAITKQEAVKQVKALYAQIKPLQAEYREAEKAYSWFSDSDEVQMQVAGATEYVPYDDPRLKGYDEIKDELNRDRAARVEVASKKMKALEKKVAAVIRSYKK